ncbi:Hsp20/alpha crystallin family protein [Pseudaeromonas paramecii]|uniref:Hsp20/alpha crystallin family protein n=1 Tax=Pseudaeromonas paramecii TaxID=2138166 RepID=A0ABP8QNM9_9GAMM
MAIERWNPFREFEDWFRDYHRGVLSRLDDRQSLSQSDWLPAVDIVENDRAYELQVEVPGMPKEDVKLSVDNGMLTISGERRQEHEDKQLHRTERFYGRFSRSFALPEDVQADDISARFQDGILYVTLAKSTPPQQRREIEIH